MRILHVVPGLAARTGGIASTTVELCRAQEATGLQTTIVGSDLAEIPSARRHARLTGEGLPAGAEALRIGLFPARHPKRLAYCPSLARALRNAPERWDIVHIHSLFLYPQLAAYRYARDGGIPYVVTPHGVFDPYLRRRGRLRKGINDALWQRAMLGGASVLHFGAASEASAADDVAPGVRRVIVPNPIDWHAFQTIPDARAFRARHLNGRSGALVLSFGRITEKKGLDVLIRAFARAAQQHPSATLAIVGPDDEGLTPRLRALARETGAERAVVFPGPLYGAERLAALAAADVWALASRGEGCSAAVLEALAAGCTVLLTPEVDPAAELAASGVALVRPGNEDDFGRTIAEVLSDGTLRSRLGDAARVFARRYDGGVIAERWRQIYETVATRREPAAFGMAAGILGGARG